MAESKEMRRLTAKWASGVGWPKRLEWIQVDGLRGWKNEKFTLNYPIMAVVGENGSGKSTLLQCCAAVYSSKPPKNRDAGDKPRNPLSRPISSRTRHGKKCKRLRFDIQSDKERTTLRKRDHFVNLDRAGAATLIALSGKSCT